MELYFHELFRRLGSACVVHPELDHSPAMLDFQLISPSGLEWYLELRHVGLQSGPSTHLSNLLTQIDEVGLHDYFIMVRTEGSLSRSAKASAVRNFLRHWIRDITRLDPSLSQAHEVELGIDSLSYLLGPYLRRKTVAYSSQG